MARAFFDVASCKHSTAISIVGVLPGDADRHGDRLMKIDGACHCGQSSYDAEIDPAPFRVCHCTDCQSLTGSAFRVVVQFSDDKFSLSSEPTVYVKTAESGTRRIQAFCPKCGSPIYSAPAEATPAS